MKAYPNKRMLILGSICIVYWFGDFIFNALIPHHFSWLLWYSSVGLLGTGIALLTGNLALLYSLFCALFLPETIWAMDFLIALFFHQDIFGLIVYANILSLSKRYFYLTLYHFIIPIALFYGLYSSKKIYKYGWIGAGFFLSSIILLTAWLVSPKDQVNCLSSLTRCKTIFSFLYTLPSLQRVFLAIMGMTLFVYFPINAIVVWVKEKHLQEVS